MLSTVLSWIPCLASFALPPSSLSRKAMAWVTTPPSARTASAAFRSDKPVVTRSSRSSTRSPEMRMPSTLRFLPCLRMPLRTYRKGFLRLYAICDAKGIPAIGTPAMRSKFFRPIWVFICSV